MSNRRCFVFNLIFCQQWQPFVCSKPNRHFGVVWNVRRLYLSPFHRTLLSSLEILHSSYWITYSEVCSLQSKMATRFSSHLHFVDGALRRAKSQNLTVFSHTRKNGTVCHGVGVGGGGGVAALGDMPCLVCFVNELFINLCIPSDHTSFLHKQCNNFDALWRHLFLTSPCPF